MTVNAIKDQVHKHFQHVLLCYSNKLMAAATPSNKSTLTLCFKTWHSMQEFYFQRSSVNFGWYKLANKCNILCKIPCCCRLSGPGIVLSMLNLREINTIFKKATIKLCTYSYTIWQLQAIIVNDEAVRHFIKSVTSWP